MSDAHQDTASARASYRCEYAWLGGNSADADVLIDVENGRISAVVSGAESLPYQRKVAATPLRGLTLPGLADVHSHAFHRALRGHTQTGTGTFWTWREGMYRVAARLDPDNYFRLARAVYDEMVLAGITGVGEFHYVHHGPDGSPYENPNAMGLALVAAAREAGLRLTLLDTCYLTGGVDRPLEGTQIRFGDTSADGWSDRVDALITDLGRRPDAAAGVRVGAAVHSVRALSPDAITVVAGWARERGSPLHAHVSEQVAENDACLAAYGRTPVELLAECGALGSATTAVHATHLTRSDIDALGESRTGVCFCPTTERDLADGIGPARALADAGSPLSLGSDSHAVIDVLEEARLVELDQRLASGLRGNFTAADLLEAATRTGHRALGWQDAGVLAVGAPADLVTIRLDSVRTAGAGSGPASAVFAATAADVHHVVCDGIVRVRDGCLTRSGAGADSPGRALDEAISEVTA